MKDFLKLLSAVLCCAVFIGARVIDAPDISKRSFYPYSFNRVTVGLATDSADVIDSIYIKHRLRNILISKNNMNIELNKTDSTEYHETQNTENTLDTRDSEDTDSDGLADNSFYFAAILLFMFVVLRGAKISAKYRKKYNKPYYREHRSDTGADLRVINEDDADFPSGFGGLGNRKAIYGEDLDDADDIGIIKRGYKDASGGGDKDNQ